jgi:hypothetical protein
MKQKSFWKDPINWYVIAFSILPAAMIIAIFFIIGHFVVKFW